MHRIYYRCNHDMYPSLFFLTGNTFFFKRKSNYICILSSTQLQDNIFHEFPTYNREWERHQDTLNEKEAIWESELNESMKQSADFTESTRTTSEGLKTTSFCSSLLQNPHLDRPTSTLSPLPLQQGVAQNDTSLNLSALPFSQSLGNHNLNNI